MASIPRPEGGPFGLLLMAVTGLVALCCAVIVATGKPAPDAPARRDEDAPRTEAARAEVEVAAAPAPAPAVEPPAPTAPEPAPEPAPADPYEPSGYLRIASTPPARIFIDGADTGLRTPIRGDRLPLAAGRHKVTFLVGDSKYTFSVRIKAGETLNLTKTFEQLPP